MVFNGPLISKFFPIIMSLIILVMCTHFQSERIGCANNVQLFILLVSRGTGLQGSSGDRQPGMLLLLPTDTHPRTPEHVGPAQD